MRFVGLTALASASLFTAPAFPQGSSPWMMHESLDWGMWLGPLLMIIPLALLIIAIASLVRWMGGRDGGARIRTAHDMLDERYARGEIDREEYLRRRDDIASRS
jgi:putative membrane protein